MRPIPATVPGCVVRIGPNGAQWGGCLLMRAEQTKQGWMICNDFLRDRVSTEYLDWLLDPISSLWMFTPTGKWANLKPTYIVLEWISNRTALCHTLQTTKSHQQPILDTTKQISSQLP